MALPSDLETRKKIADAVERAYNLKNEIDILLSDIADIGDTLKEETKFPPKEFNKLVASRYEGAKLLEKAQTKVSEVADANSAVEILKKLV